MNIELPIVGVAMMVADLDRHHNWIIEGRRDLELQDFIDPAILDGDWRGYVERARHQLDGHDGRLGIHGPFYDLPLAASDPAIREVVRHRLDQALAACEALSATHLVVHSPYTTWDYHNLDRLPGQRERMLELCHLTMGAAVKRAEGIGCTLVIENIEDKDPYARVELARSFRSPAVAVSLDTGHAHYAHGSTGAPPVDYYVIAAGKDLAHIHLQDADGYADRHWAPGQGTIHWHAVFDALRRTGANPRLIVELEDFTNVREATEWLIAEGLAR